MPIGNGIGERLGTGEALPMGAVLSLDTAGEKKSSSPLIYVKTSAPIPREWKKRVKSAFLARVPRGADLRKSPPSLSMKSARASGSSYCPRLLRSKEGGESPRNTGQATTAYL